MSGRTMVVVLAVVVLGMAAGASAQLRRLADVAPGVRFSNLGLDEAIDAAAARHRFLVVYLFDPTQPAGAEMDKTTWKNPTLAAWIQWHADAIRVDVGARPDVIRRLGIKKRAELPAVVMMKGKRVVARVLTGVMPGGGVFGDMRGARAPDGRIGGIMYPRPLRVLLQLDFAREREAAKDPAWNGLHERRNPPPEPPPPPDPFHQRADEFAPAAEDGAEGDAGAPFDALGRLERARRMAWLGDLAGATAEYTWLWERADALEPELGPVRRGLIAGEMAELARRREGSRGRFAAMRDAHSARLLWADYEDLQEWATLNSVAADDDLTFEWFGTLLMDDLHMTLVPVADRLAYEELLRRESYADPWELPRNPVERIDRLRRPLGNRRPVTIPPEEWQRLQRFLGRLVVDEGCRLHAACLRAGRDDEAAQIARIVLATHDSAGARLSLVASAAVAGTVRSEHLDWLTRAEAMGEPRPALRQRIERALAGEPPLWTPAADAPPHPDDEER